MGTDGRGATSLAAMKFGATWATAVECGANDGVRINSSGIGGGKEVILDESVAGSGFGNASHRGQEMHRGSVPLTFRYGGRCSEILAAIMGTAGAPTEVEASLEYTHLLSMETRLGDFFTWCERRGDVAVWEYLSAMITRLVIEISGRGPASMEAEMILCGKVRDDSGTNTLATFANVTVRDPLVPVFGGHCRFRLNDQEGGALGSGDVLKPSLLRLTIDRGLDEKWLADQSIGEHLSQPSEQADVGIFLQLGFPEYQADTYQKWVDDKDQKKADLYITNSRAPLTGAASGLYHEYDFDFPHLDPVERPENLINGPERIEDGITFRQIVAASNPTGMSSTNLVCTVRNQISTNLLA
jgi:hypothetical protein